VKLAHKVGAHAAAEIVLLMVARRNTRPAEKQRLGIPWKAKTWAGLRAIMEKYNKMVSPMPMISETQSSSSNAVASGGVVLSDSPLNNLALDADDATSLLGNAGANDDDQGWDIFPPVRKHPAPVPERVPASLLPTSPYAPRPGLLAPTRRPPELPEEPRTGAITATASPSSANPEPTPSEARAMFQQLAKKAPRPTCKKNWFEAGQPITREQLHREGITLKSSESTCKFSKKPKYFCEVKPNDWNLTWLYSCPCADCGEDIKGTHLFFNDDDLTQQCGDNAQANYYYHYHHYYHYYYYCYDSDNRDNYDNDVDDN
jgi:hypothetical protein